MNEISIREMRPQDLYQVLYIEKRSFPTPWTRMMFLYELHSPISFAYVATEEKEIWGYIVYRLVAQEVHIMNLAVHPERRRCGIGTSLLQFCFEQSLRRGAVLFLLEVRESNEAAINLYRKMGFTPSAIRRNYYRDRGEDAIVMKLLWGDRIYGG